MFNYSSERALKAERYLPNLFTYEGHLYQYQGRIPSDDGRHYVLYFKGKPHTWDLYITQNAKREVVQIQKIPY